MAIGDDAAAAGMDLVPSTGTEGKVRFGWREINKTRDYIAQKITAAIAALWPVPISKGGTGKTTATDALAALGAWRNSGAVAPGTSPLLGWNGSRLQFEIPGYAFATELARMSDIPSGVGPNLTLAGQLYLPASSIATSGWTNAYINGPDGRVSRGASSRRYKKDIAAWSADKQAVLAMQVVSFHYRAALFAADDPLRTDPPLEVGLIAEDLHDLGLTWLVAYDDQGRPDNIRYERIALALLPVIQDHEARLDALEADRAG